MKNIFKLSFQCSICTIMLNPLALQSRIDASRLYYRNIARKKASTTSLLKTCFTTTVKPLNILVYSGDKCKNVENVVHFVETCLKEHQYTVYSLCTSQLLNEPWVENTKAIIVLPTFSSSSIIEEIKASLKCYRKQGGRILNFSFELFEKQNTNQLAKFLNYTGKLDLDLYDSNNDAFEKTVVCSLKTWKGLVFAGSAAEQCLVRLHKDHTCVACFCGDEKSQLNCVLPLLDPDQTLEMAMLNRNILSYLLHSLDLGSTWNSTTLNCASLLDSKNHQAYLYTTDYSLQSTFVKSICSSISSNEPGLTFSTTFHDKDLSAEKRLPITLAESSKGFASYFCNFNWDCYKNSLFSKAFGKVVLYMDVISSTMTVFDGISTKLPLNLGPIAIARQQTKGQGRSSNKWLSPVGCAMFTMVVHVPINSHLGSALPFLQHLTSVAVVHAIRTMPGLQEVNLSVKWPNDIYYGSSIKLGGVLVKSTLYRDMCIASIGCGVNISNEKPTVSVNQILKEYYGIDRELTCEEVIARTVSYLEQFVDNFLRQGPESFLQLYYKYWIHSNTAVVISKDGQQHPSTIVGVDEFGFLRARRHDDGTVVSLHPDGNSFDITKNLIVAKKT